VARWPLSHVSASCLRGRATRQPRLSQGRLVLVLVMSVSGPYGRISGLDMAPVEVVASEPLTTCTTGIAYMVIHLVLLMLMVVV